MRTLSVLAVVLLLAPPLGRGAVPTSRLQQRDSVAINLHARASADAFVQRWRYYWEVSERYRHMDERRRPSAPAFVGDVPPLGWSPPAGVTEVVLSRAESLSVAAEWAASVRGFGGDWRGWDPTRVGLLHCHPGGMGGRADFSANVIDSRLGAFTQAVYTTGANGTLPRTRAICPHWYVGGDTPPWDERTDFDAAIVAPLRPRVAAARAALLVELDSAATALPGDGWIAGQRVRFALDQGDTAAAVRAARACRAVEWWCDALAGYLVALQRDIPRADSIFGRVTARMPAGERCAWSNLSILLDGKGREEYERTSCAARDSINARIWWLADPLFLETGNERRVEHYARRVLLALRGGTDINEKWDMRRVGGGVIVAEMLVRYGWPSFSYWEGRDQDLDHYDYIGINPAIRRGAAKDSADTLVAHGRFTTAEYAGPRFHPVPLWSAITTPWSAQELDWEISAAAHETVLPAGAGWWPVEHYDRPSGPLVPLWTQRGLFRREEGALLAMGMDVPADQFGGAVGDTLRGALVLSTAEDSMDVRSTEMVVGYGSVIGVLVASRPQIVSLELFGFHPKGVAARTRFGIDPPQPLSAMRAGEIAIVPPVLVRPPAAGELPPTDPDGALGRMHGAVISDWMHVGFYWETYGVGAGDTVDVEMRLERRPEQPGFFRRLGYSLGIGQPSTGTVTFKWREPDASHAVLTAAGPVPIQGRNVTLDLSQLGLGEYTLVVSIARPGATPVTASRPFWIERR